MRLPVRLGGGRHGRCLVLPDDVESESPNCKLVGERHSCIEFCGRIGQASLPQCPPLDFKSTVMITAITQHVHADIFERFAALEKSGARAEEGAGVERRAGANPAGREGQPGQDNEDGEAQALLSDRSSQAAV